MDGVKKIKN